MKKLILLLFFCILSASGGILFQDDFNDGNADGWHEISWVEYGVIDGMYRMYGGYEENHGISFNGDDSGYMSTPDYSAVCLIVPETGVFFGMMCRFIEDSEYNIMIVLSSLHQSLKMYRWDGFGLVLLDQTPFTVQMHEQYRLRYEVSGNTFRGKAWTGEPWDEPDQWMVSSTDTLSSPGSVALFCAGLSKVSLSCLFDDVIVTDPISELAPISWAGIKNSLW